MLRILLPVLLTLTSPLLAAPLTDAATGIIFPGSPGRWLRVDYHEYDPKELYGVSYGYKLEGSLEGVVTCYIYSKGLKTIPAGADSDLVRDEILGAMQGVVDAWAQRGGEVTELLPISAVRTKTDNRLLAVLGAQRIRHQGTTSVSLTVLTSYKDQFLKIRHTFPGEDLEVALNNLGEFVRLLFTANAAVFPEVNLSSEPVALPARSRVAISIDPADEAVESGAVWVAYAIIRLQYRTENNLPLPPRGEILPGFVEEITGRTQALNVYRELKEKNPGLMDRYWEDLLKVEAAGFIAPYVWANHRHPHWPKSERPADLDKFQKWRKKNLKGHKPQTHAGLVIESGS